MLTENDGPPYTGGRETTMAARKSGASAKGSEKPKLDQRLLELGRKSQQSKKKSMSVKEVNRMLGRMR